MGSTSISKALTMTVSTTTTTSAASTTTLRSIESQPNKVVVVVVVAVVVVVVFKVWQINYYYPHLNPILTASKISITTRTSWR